MILGFHKRTDAQLTPNRERAFRDNAVLETRMCLLTVNNRDLGGIRGTLAGYRDTNCVHPRNGCNQMQEFLLYLADASSSDKTPLRYNVSNFLNSATTRTLPLESASP